MNEGVLMYYAVKKTGKFEFSSKELRELYVELITQYRGINRVKLEENYDEKRSEL